MLTHTNIDRSDAAQVSKAPFTYESTMLLDGNLIPSGSFVALKVYVYGSMSVPFRMHSIRQDGKVVFCDATGALAVYWQTYPQTEEIAPNDVPYVSSLLFDDRGIIAGSVTCTHTVMSVIRGIIDSNTETFFVPSDAFILIPQCHVAMLEGHARSFGISNQAAATTYITSDLHLTCDNEMLISGSTDSLQLSLTNTADAIRAAAPTNGICGVVINGQTYCCADSSIILKSSICSNLRVIKENQSITLRGVLNA